MSAPVCYWIGVGCFVVGIVTLVVLSICIAASEPDEDLDRAFCRLIGPRAGDPETAVQEFTADADEWDITPADRTLLASWQVRA